MISRRTLLQSSPLALAGLATLIRPREAFAIRPIIPPPPTIDPTILEAHFTTGQNLQTSLFGSGANAASVSAHAIAASTLFAEAARLGTTANINSQINANAASLNSFGTSFTDTQLETLYTTITPLFPGVTQGDVDSALAWLTVPSGTMQSLPGQGVVPQQNNFLSLLGQVANGLNGGVIVASEGIRPRPPQIRDANCIAYIIGVGLLGASAFLTDGLSAGVIWGVEVTWSEIFGGAAMIGGGLAKVFNCN